MQVLLRIANGKSNVRKVRLHSDTTIGRSPECQLKVASNQISRRHCQIVIRETLVAIKDLGSANGTFVNGRKVPAEVEIPLTPGTRVMLGPLHFTVEYELPGVPVSTPVVTEMEVVTTALTFDTADDDGQLPEPDVAMETVEQPSPFRQEVEVPQFAVPLQPSLPEPQPAHVASPSPPVQPAPAPVVASVVAAVAWQAPVSPTPVPGLGDTAYTSPPVPATPVAPAAIVAPAMPVAAVVNMAAPVIPATPVAVAPEVAPVIMPAEEPSEPDDGSFNFGIFAASGSGVVVESAAEIPIFDPTASSAPASQEMSANSAKPAKKGFLQMLGWGKKKTVSPAPLAAAASVASEPVADEIAVEPASVEPAAEMEPAETPVAGTLSFEVPNDQDEVADEGDGAEDEALKNFFNNFK